MFSKSLFTAVIVLRILWLIGLRFAASELNFIHSSGKLFCHQKFIRLSVTCHWVAVFHLVVMGSARNHMESSVSTGIKSSKLGAKCPNAGEIEKFSDAWSSYASIHKSSCSTKNKKCKLRQADMVMENYINLKKYVLLKMMMFHCHLSLKTES